jgi:NAD+--asparagine ADP-ribosyltransferase
MPIEINLGLLSQDVKDSVKDGALDDDVMVQFLCNTGEGGEHDPDEEPDDRVRPSHAAFHGQIFALGEAPVPPLDYGCRCAIRYVSVKGSEAEKVVEEVTEEEPTTTVEATEQWLDDNVDGWKTVKRAMKTAGVKDAMAVGIKVAKAKEIDNARMIVEMITDVMRGAEDE